MNFRSPIKELKRKGIGIATGKAGVCRFESCWVYKEVLTFLEG